MVGRWPPVHMPRLGTVVACRPCWLCIVDMRAMRRNLACADVVVLPLLLHAGSETFSSRIASMQGRSWQPCRSHCSR